MSTVWPDLHRLLSAMLLSIGALLPVMDPLGGAPVYLAMTSDLDPRMRRGMVKTVALDSFVLLLATNLVGIYVLDFFGVSVAAVQVAGGVLIGSIAWSMLNGPLPEPNGRQLALARGTSPESVRVRAFYPLTMPLTVGPGAISIALTLGAGRLRTSRPMLETMLAHAAGIVVVSAAVYVCYRYADRIVARLGPVGTGVVVKLSAFVLLCIGVQVCWDGISSLIGKG